MSGPDRCERTGKQAFPTSQAAHSAREAMLHARRGRGGSRSVMVYRCDFCTAYHFKDGSKDRAKRRALLTVSRPKPPRTEERERETEGGGW